ncbi:hypothetical protein CF132_05600 [Aeromonas dhakensis]|nr:hypothetical protein CF132_05600 [Aeromonas dhakensis]
MNMTVLYKYYSSAFDLEKYLREPTLRLAQLTTLNDPFEGTINRNAIAILAEKLCRFAAPEENIDHLSLITAERSINNIIDTYGVTSLSETHRNLLMWAHYASEHRGICIGYNHDVLPQEDIIISDSESLKPYPLIKVNYDNVIFDHELIESLNDFKFDEEEPFKKVSIRALTTKSEEWSYEKEHRFLSHLELSDRIVVFKNRDKLSPRQAQLFKIAESRGSYTVTYNENFVCATSNESELSKTGNIYTIDSLENQFRYDKEVFFLKNIKKKKISSIYFGVNHPAREIERIINEVIMCDDELKHVKVYKYSLSDERYELYPIKLHPKHR